MSNAVSPTRPILTINEFNSTMSNMMMPPTQIAEPYTQFVDASGILHRFHNQRDYLAYLDEQDLELIGRKS